MPKHNSEKAILRVKERIAGVEQSKTKPPSYCVLPWAGLIQDSLSLALGCFLSLSTQYASIKLSFSCSQDCCLEAHSDAVNRGFSQGGYLPVPKISITHLLGLQINWQRS